MKRYLLLLSLLLACAPARADFESALKAYQDREYEAAFGEFVQAARAGDARAQHWAARLMLAGVGTRRDPGRAAQFMMLAASQGLPEAEYDYALMHLSGRGVEREPSYAWELLKKTAAKNFQPARTMIAILHYEGIGTAKDVAKARGLLEAEAEAGDFLAQAYLGILIAGLPPAERDLAEAYKWLKIAAPGLRSEVARRDSPFNIADIDRILGKLGSQMKPEEIARGDAAVQEWLAKRQPAAPGKPPH